MEGYLNALDTSRVYKFIIQSDKAGRKFKWGELTGDFLETRNGVPKTAGTFPSSYVALLANRTYLDSIETKLVDKEYFDEFTKARELVKEAKP
jgi:hypothetical protein